MGILEKMRLDGKVAFVTGGARGIGYSIATALAEAGAELALLDIDLHAAQEAAQTIAKQTGKTTRAYAADVTDAAVLHSVVEQLAGELGGLDIAVCNAGICLNSAAETMNLNEWNQVIGINLSGVFLTAQAAGQIMLKQGSGSIINIASMSAHIVNVPQPQCAYNASKAGVIQLTKSLAVEWAARNVRVNSISPGYMGTELVMNAPHLKALIEKWNAVAPMGRLGKPEELQAIAVYLAGDQSSFTTGSDFVIDGAFSAI